VKNPPTTAPSSVEKVKADNRRRQQHLALFADEDADLEQHIGRRLDALEPEQLRELFDVAFGSNAEFEWGLQVRRARISGPQRSQLLRAFASNHPQDAHA
jgi:hypothetical protein